MKIISKVVAVLFLAAFGGFYNQAFAGTLTAQVCEPVPCSYRFEGEITLEDINAFAAIKENPNDGIVIVYLKSNGGNVYAALKIAEILDSRKAFVIIKKGDQCFSSCVLVFSGGVIRTNHGTLGIHGIYSVDVNDTYEESRKRVDEIESAVKSRFRHAGIPEKLWSEMQAVPPDKIRNLTAKEQHYFNLAGGTPAYKDYQEVRLARDLGITRQELIGRRQLSAQVCGDIPKNMKEYDKWHACDAKVVDRTP